MNIFMSLSFSPQAATAHTIIGGKALKKKSLVDQLDLTSWVYFVGTDVFFLYDCTEETRGIISILINSIYALGSVNSNFSLG